MRSQWLEDARRDAGGLESLPDFIALPRDEAGRPIIPTSRVTALVEAREAWATELGSLDAVTRSITRGQLVMPRISAPSQQTVLRNHPSWENDEDAKRALGPVIAKWLAPWFLSTQHGTTACPSCCSHAGPIPRAPHRSTGSSRTPDSPTSSTSSGGHAHYRSTAQQNADQMRLPLLPRHFRRLPLSTSGRVRRRAPPDQAADSFVPRPGPAQRGLLGGRAGQRLHTVDVPRWLR